MLFQIIEHAHIQLTQIIGKPGRLVGYQAVPREAPPLQIQRESLRIPRPVADLERLAREQRTIPPVRMVLGQRIGDALDRVSWAAPLP
jgi:hypothetical protein